MLASMKSLSYLVIASYDSTGQLAAGSSRRPLLRCSRTMSVQPWRFSVDSSSRFPVRARTYRQTDRQDRTPYPRRWLCRRE